MEISEADAYDGLLCIFAFKGCESAIKRDEKMINRFFNIQVRNWSGAFLINLQDYIFLSIDLTLCNLLCAKSLASAVLSPCCISASSLNLFLVKGP